MRPRIRWIAGLFALAAMTFSFGETVMAAACESDMAGHAAAMTMEHADHDAPGHRPEQEGGDDEPCPFGDVAFQLCGGMVSLPSYSATAAAPAPHRVVGGFMEPASHRLLLDTDLFRPPRA